jgi:hypothetical protein
MKGIVQNAMDQELLESPALTVREMVASIETSVPSYECFFELIAEWPPFPYETQWSGGF